MAASSPIILSRDQLTSVQNLFLLNLANKDFLLGTKKRRPNVPTLAIPIIIFLIVFILIGCPAAGAAGTSDSSNTLIGLAVIFGIPGVIFFFLSIRAYRRALLLDTEGKLLQATITSISTHERDKRINVILWSIAILVIILALIDMFSGGSGSGGADTPGDYYQVVVEFTATTPTGEQISGKAKQNRPDLRENGLPVEGDPLVLLYVDDGLYKLM